MNIERTRPTTVALVAGVLLTTACSGGRDLSTPAASFEPRDEHAPGSTVIVEDNVVYDEMMPVMSVPAADCGPGANPETGIQGQVPMTDRESGRSLEGYSCNLEKIGAAGQGEGASWQFAWYDDCAYYGTLFTFERETEPGAVVIDASNPEQPFVSDILTTPGVMDPHESLKVNEARGLLGAVDTGPNYDTEGSGTGGYFDVYDVKTDCAKPKLLASVDLFDEGVKGHEGDFSPDGMTYYATYPGGDLTPGAPGGFYAIDISDPTQPRLLFRNEADVGAIHGLSVSDDGTRAYVSNLDLGKFPGNGPAATGLHIYDVSEIQARKPNPTIRRITEHYWTFDACGQASIPITIKGKPYLVYFSECGFGGARLIDISDELNPRIVSLLTLDVHTIQNRPVASADAAFGIIQYDSHYCSVDRRHEATTVACGYNWSGIRVFDIRDPVNPREIAYYIPPGVGDVPKPGSSNSLGPLVFAQPPEGVLAVKPVDVCSAQVRLIPERAELWTQCQDNEFFALRFTNGVWPFPE